MIQVQKLNSPRINSHYSEFIHLLSQMNIMIKLRKQQTMLGKEKAKEDPESHQ